MQKYVKRFGFFKKLLYLCTVINKQLFVGFRV